MHVSAIHLVHLQVCSVLFSAESLVIFQNWLPGIMSAPSAVVNKQWALGIHGGAGVINSTNQVWLSDAEKGLEASLRAGEAVLAVGGSAIDAVVAAVACLENDPHFNAGRLLESMLAFALHIVLTRSLSENDTVLMSVCHSSNLDAGSKAADNTSCSLLEG